MWGISLKRERCHLHLNRLRALASIASQFQSNAKNRNYSQMLSQGQIELDFKCLVSFIFAPKFKPLKTIMALLLVMALLTFKNSHGVTHFSLSLLIASSKKTGSRPTRLQPPLPLALEDLGTSKKNQNSEYVVYINFQFAFFCGYLFIFNSVVFDFSLPLFYFNLFLLPYWTVLFSKKGWILR